MFGIVTIQFNTGKRKLKQKRRSFNQIFPRVIRHFSSFCMGKWIYQIASTHKNSCFASNPNLFFRNHHNCRNTCLKSFTAPAPKKLTFHCMAWLRSHSTKVSRHWKKVLANTTRVDRIKVLVYHYRTSLISLNITGDNWKLELNFPILKSFPSIVAQVIKREIPFASSSSSTLLCHLQYVERF